MDRNGWNACGLPSHPTQLHVANCPPFAASAWERPFSAGALQNLNQQAPKQRKQQDKQKGRQPGAPSSAGERAAPPAAQGAAGAAGAAASGPAEGKKKSKLQKRGKAAAKAAAAAAPVDPAGAAVAPDSDASDFEDGSGAAAEPGAKPPKRRKVAGKAAAAGDAGAAAGKPMASIRASASGKGKASASEQLGALAEALDVVPLAVRRPGRVVRCGCGCCCGVGSLHQSTKMPACPCLFGLITLLLMSAMQPGSLHSILHLVLQGVADVCTPLGFERFARDMGKAASCRCAVKCVE